MPEPALFSFSAYWPLPVHQLLVVRVDAQQLAPERQHGAAVGVLAAIDDGLLHVLHAILQIGQEGEVVLHEHLHELEQAVTDGGLLQNALRGDFLETRAQVVPSSRNTRCVASK